MFNLEKREKFILLVLLATLLIGMAFGLYQKRAVQVDIRPNSFVPSERGFPSETLKININESDADQLMRLKGIGKVLADRIVDYRSKNGNFISVEELKKVKGVGQKLYERIKNEVSVD